MASQRLLASDLSRIANRARRLGWVVSHTGAYVRVTMRRLGDGEEFRMLLSCPDYPLRPCLATFLPASGDDRGLAKWPDDENRAFRTGGPFPFVCMAGLGSYVPDAAAVGPPFSRRDVRVGAVLTRVWDALNLSQGVVLRELTGFA